MRIIRIHHAQITIPLGTEAEGRLFYCKTLGLPEVEKPQSLQGRGGFWVQAGDLQVHIGMEEGVQRSATKAHLAYQVDDLGAWRTRLQEKGAEILEGAPIPDHDRFEFRDPFGNRIELIQRAVIRSEGKGTADATEAEAVD